jgi:hypothetical protein
MGIDFLGASTFFPRVLMTGERIPKRSVTPVAMQTGVQSTSVETEKAGLSKHQPPLRGDGIGSRFALRQTHGNRDDAVRGVGGAKHHTVILGLVPRI